MYVISHGQYRYNIKLLDNILQIQVLLFDNSEIFEM